MLLVRCLWHTQLLMTSKHLKTWSGAQKEVWAGDTNFRFAFMDGNWSHVRIWDCLQRMYKKWTGKKLQDRDLNLYYLRKKWREQKSLQKSSTSHGEKTKNGAHRKESLEEKIDPKWCILLRGQFRYVLCRRHCNEYSEDFRNDEEWSLPSKR